VSSTPIDAILERACRAPSVHNTQPWRWEVSDDDVRLRADPSRRLPVIDPDGRDLMISCGAALHHLQVAAAGLGWSARVTRFPDPSDHGLLAVARLRPSRVSSEQRALLGAIERRRTDRRRFSSWPVPPQWLRRLAGVGSGWGSQVLPVESPGVRSELELLTRRAARIQNVDDGYVRELTTWAGTSGPDGIPARSLPAGGVASAGTAPQGILVDRLNRAFPAGTMSDPAEDLEPSQDGMLLVCTSSDDAVSRLRAGEALSAVWLTATLDNVAVVPLSQALEVDETRRELTSEVLGDLAYPQILIRIGWPVLDRDPLPPTPRRPLDETVVRISPGAP